jgi:hypothetical protein
MSETVLAAKLTRGIRTLAALADDPAADIERYLEAELRPLPPVERLRQLQGIAGELGMSPGAAPEAAVAGPEIGAVVRRILGKEAETEHLAPDEAAEKLAACLDTVFETLNDIVFTINVTLLGRSPELETIRKVIGTGLHGEAGYEGIKEYLDRIRKAFLVAHQSFQDAADAVLKEMLEELAPDPRAEERISPLKFGPLRKAELFDQYAEKRRRCMAWLDGGQHRERFLREFEKRCQHRFETDTR